MRPNVPTPAAGAAPARRVRFPRVPRGVASLASALPLLGAALLAGSCGTLSSRILTDPAPAVGRLRAGGAIGDEVERLARPLVTDREYYGIAVGVVTPDGATRTFGYGLSGRPGDTRAPAGDDLFQVGSLSKLLVAALLERLVEEGKLRYEDTVRDILPPEVPLGEGLDDVTLRDLMSHTSGLPREPAGLTQFGYLVKFLFTGRNLYGYIDRPFLYEYLRTVHIEPRERRGCVYSSLGVALLAHLIEVRTGRSLPDLVREKVCGPLGMRDTVFFPDPEQLRRLAVGHVGAEPKFMGHNRPLRTWDMGDVMRPSGGVYSTVDDLLLFAKANLGMLGHPLERCLAATHEVQVVTPEEDVALGWVIDHLDDGRVSIVYKHGMVSGYSAYIGMNVDRHVAVVVLYANFAWDDAIGHNLILRLVDGLPPRASE